MEQIFLSPDNNVYRRIRGIAEIRNVFATKKQIFTMDKNGSFQDITTMPVLIFDPTQKLWIKAFDYPADDNRLIIVKSAKHRVSYFNRPKSNKFPLCLNCDGIKVARKRVFIHNSLINEFVDGLHKVHVPVTVVETT